MNIINVPLKELEIRSLVSCPLDTCPDDGLEVTVCYTCPFNAGEKGCQWEERVIELPVCLDCGRCPIELAAVEYPCVCGRKVLMEFCAKSPYPPDDGVVVCECGRGILLTAMGDQNVGGNTKLLFAVSVPDV